MLSAQRDNNDLGSAAALLVVRFSLRGHISGKVALGGSVGPVESGFSRGRKRPPLNVGNLAKKEANRKASTTIREISDYQGRG